MVASHNEEFIGLVLSFCLVYYAISVYMCAKLLLVGESIVQLTSGGWPFYYDGKPAVHEQITLSQCIQKKSRYVYNRTSSVSKDSRKRRPDNLDFVLGWMLVTARS